MAEGLREAYEDVFHISETPAQKDREAIEGLFKTRTNSSDRVAELQAATFLALLKYADLKAPAPTPAIPQSVQRPVTSAEAETAAAVPPPPQGGLVTELHYTIQVHLPATKDIEVFNAIFRSLRENLLGR
jgi:hypothetical protein